MGGIPGIPFPSLPASGQGDALSQLLLSGAILRGRIATDGALLNLIVAGQRIPLPKTISLPAGTVVNVQLVQEEGTPQLRLRPLETSPVPAPSGQTGPSQGLVAQPVFTSEAAKRLIASLPAALKSLIEPEQAAALLPRAATIPPKAVEALLSALVVRSEIGRELEQLVARLNAEVARSRLPEELAAPVRAAIAAFDAESPDEFRRAIEAARNILSTPPDRAQPTTTHDARPAARDLIEELGRVRDQLVARASTPDAARATADTIKSIDGVINRLGATNLQNIRALDTPYQFFAIPFAPRTGIDHAQIHMLGSDGRGSVQGGGRRAHFVAIDLHLSQLGALWITIQSAGPTCSCVIRAENESSRSALDTGAPALEAGLRRAGFSAAQVRTEPWDGNRADAAAEVFAAPSSFEAEA